MLKDKSLILMSAEGALERLPWGALPGEKPDTYLLEDHRLALFPVPRLLPGLMQDANGAEPQIGLLIVECQDVASEGAASLERIYKKAFTHAAAKDIERLIGNQTANSKFQELAPISKYIHLDVGLFSTTPDEERTPTAEFGSADGLANGKSSRGDGVPTAEGLAFLPLKAVRLVVLSAGEKEWNANSNGESVFEIQRSLQIAGVGTTMAALWTVDEPIKQELMDRFHENLWQKRMSNLDALRETQLWALKHPERFPGIEAISGQPFQTPPDYWASFQISGDWR
jgi:CHAT domain-containing protein